MTTTRWAVATIVADAIDADLAEVRKEIGLAIGERAAAWLSAHELLRALPDENETAERESADELVRAAILLSTASGANAATRREALMRAAVKYGEPMRTTEAAKLREALERIAGRLGNALDGISSARSYIDSAIAGALAPENL